MTYRKMMLFSLASILLIKAFRSTRKQLPTKESSTPHDQMWNDAHQSIVQYAHSRKVVFISIRKKIYYAKDIAGQPVLWSHSFAASIAALPRDQYFQLGRSCIVHRDIIASVDTNVSEHKLTLVLAPPFNLQIDLPANKIIAFKVWMNQI